MRVLSLAAKNAPDVARAPTPLQQGRGGLATPSGLATSTSAMPDIVQTWKSVSSHRINKLIGRKGALWQSDYYNHIIRTPSEYSHQINYVLHNNMVAARQFDVAMTADVARAPSPLQQGRGGLATSEGLATPSDPTTSEGLFPGKNRHFWPEVDIHQGEALPRWSMGRAIYHICFRLADSVPQSKLREWETAREEFRHKQKNGEKLSEDELRELKNLYSENIEKYLDAGYGECLLRNSGVADVVIETMLHDNGTAYIIHAFGIMPNHVHVIAEFDVARAPSPLQQGRLGLATPAEM